MALKALRQLAGKVDLPSYKAPVQVIGVSPDETRSLVLDREKLRATGGNKKKNVSGHRAR